MNTDNRTWKQIENKLTIKRLRLWMTFPMYENLYMYYHDWVVCSSWDHSPNGIGWVRRPVYPLGDGVSIDFPNISQALDFTDFTLVRGSIFQQTWGAYNQGCKSPLATWSCWSRVPGVDTSVFSHGICHVQCLCIPHTRWCPQSIAKLVEITPISLWFIGAISIVNEVYKPIYI